MLRITDVTLRHPNGLRALNGVQLQIARGERVAIIGPSGAGKTSLLRIAGASLRPSGGQIDILGANPWQLRASQLRSLRSRIGFIHQAPPIPARLRVVTAVLAGRVGQWPTWRSLLSLLYPLDIAGAREALTRTELADRLFDRCDRLSGGQLQRVGIARVLYQEPDLILADEPVSALDPTMAASVIQHLFQQSQRTGATLVASLHAVDLALQWFPRVVGLRAGEVLFDVPADQVSQSMLHDLYASETTLASQQVTVKKPFTDLSSGDTALKPAALVSPRC